MRYVPKCPECGWALEFLPDQHNKWTGTCWNESCKKRRRRWRPSDLGWTEAKTLEILWNRESAPLVTREREAT